MHSNIQKSQDLIDQKYKNYEFPKINHSNTELKPNPKFNQRKHKNKSRK